MKINPNLSHPIVFIHEGSQGYLQTAIEYARSYGNYTILIGDDSSIGSVASEFYKASAFDNANYLAFKKNYIHMSSNSETFELLCFKRYFILLELAKLKEFDKFYLIDSDVLLLDNFNNYYSDFLSKNNYLGALSTPVQDSMDWASSPHFSFWTIDTLTSFVNFLLEIYKEPILSKLQLKYQYHLDSKLPGGICDMTALFLWIQKFGEKNIFNTAMNHLVNDSLIDHNINSRGGLKNAEFLVTQLLGVKKIKSIENRYFAFLNRSNKSIPVSALHFQGSAKKFIPLFFAYKNLNFFCGSISRILGIQHSIKIAQVFYLLISIFASLKHLRIYFSKGLILDQYIKPEIFNDEFYDALSALSRNPQVKKILEIGSSSGEGSTQAIINGINKRSDNQAVFLYCMELSKLKYGNLCERSESHKFIKAFNLSSISRNKMPRLTSIIRFYFNHQTKFSKISLKDVIKWYASDMQYLSNHKAYFDGITIIKSLEKIDFFDLVIIDGSEFSGEAELELIYGAKYIALDDTETYKSFNAMKKLRESDCYFQVAHRPDIRNGYAIFRRKDVSL